MTFYHCNDINFYKLELMLIDLKKRERAQKSKIFKITPKNACGAANLVKIGSLL